MRLENEDMWILRMFIGGAVSRRTCMGQMHFYLDLLGVRMCIMPHATPSQCVCAHSACGWARCQKLVRTVVESNLKSEHNLYLACEDSPQQAFFFCTFSYSLLALLASIVHWLRCFLFLSVAKHWLCSGLDSKHVRVEDQPRCPPYSSLSRSAIFPCPHR